MLNLSLKNHDLLRAATTFRLSTLPRHRLFRGSSWYLVLRKSSKSGSKPHLFTTGHTTYGRRTVLRFQTAIKFCLGIVKSQVGVGVQRDADIRVTHDVLRGFRAHSTLCHVGAEGMSAYVGCDLCKHIFHPGVGSLHPAKCGFGYPAAFRL